MKHIQNLVGGFAGAAALNILHQAAAQLDADAPRVDLVGEEAVTNISKAAGINPPKGDALFYTTLAGDIVSNGLFYSLIGMGRTKNLLLIGGSLGLLAGLGAVVLPEPLGLDDKPVTKTAKTKVMTVGWYVAGGIVAGVVIRALRSRSDK